MRLQRVFANWRIFGVLVNDASAWGGEGYMYAQGLEDGGIVLDYLRNSNPFLAWSSAASSDVSVNADELHVISNPWR